MGGVGHRRFGLLQFGQLRIFLLLLALECSAPVQRVAGVSSAAALGSKAMALLTGLPGCSDEALRLLLRLAIESPPGSS